MNRRAILSASLCVALLALLVHAGIFRLSPFELEPSYIVYQRVGMFPKDDTPAGTHTPYMRPSFNVHQVSQAPGHNATSVVAEMVLFHSDFWENVGEYDDNGYSFFCCTPKYHSSNQCPELDRLVLSPKVDKNGTYGDKFYYSAISVPIDGTVNLALDREPRHKGYWYLIVGNCDASSAVTLSLTGTTVWRNPYGWLPGQVDFLIALLYLLALAVWTTRLVMHRKDLQLLQYLTTGLLFIGALEGFLWGGAYIDYNSVGSYNRYYVGINAIITAIKLGSVRYMTLLMAVGFTITRNMLPLTIKIPLGVLLVLYMAAAFTDEYIKFAILGGTSISETAVLLISFLLIFFNLLIIVWTIIALSRSMKRTRGKNDDKYTLFLRLLIIFVVSTVVLGVIFLAEVIIDWSGGTDKAMEWQWLFQSIWDWIYLVLSLYIAWVWKPTGNNLRFAYIPLDDQDEAMRDMEDNTQKDSKKGKPDFVNENMRDVPLEDPQLSSYEESKSSSSSSA